MNRIMIVICGYLAGGKSTFARMLSKELNVPCFIKDTFKIAICEHISVISKADKSRFSTVTFDAMMYAAERLMETGLPVIIEGNFVPKGVKSVDEAGVIQALVDKYQYQTLVFKFTGNTRVLCDRFNAREKLPERGDVNRGDSELSYDVFDAYCRSLDAFDVDGITIHVNTTDFTSIEFEGLIDTARCVLGDADMSI